MRKLDLYWMSNESWFHMEESGVYIINDDAPDEAQKSYAHFLEQCQEIESDFNEGKSLD